MKTYSAIVASLLLAAGSTAVYAGDTKFSEADQNGDGSIDRQEAMSAGISTEKFQELDGNGDGVLSEEEYSQHRKDDSAWGDDSNNDM